MIRFTFRSAAAALAAASLLSLSSCTQYQQQGAAVGALAGAGVGALAGDDTDDVVRGAAIGAGLGAGAAAVKEESDRRKGYYNTGGDQAPPPQPKPSTGNYPKGFKTDNPVQVISPYEPHNLIDISKNPKTGQPFQSGDLVKDPSNGQIFRLP